MVMLQLQDTRAKLHSTDPSSRAFILPKRRLTHLGLLPSNRCNDWWHAWAQGHLVLQQPMHCTRCERVAQQACVDIFTLPLASS